MAARNGIIPHCYPGDFYGSVTIDGMDTCEASLTDISRLVGSVCQDIDSQMVSSVVEDEVLYGLENFGVPERPGGRPASPRRWRQWAFPICAIAVSPSFPAYEAEGGGGVGHRVEAAQGAGARRAHGRADPASSLAVFELLARYARENGTTVIVVEQKIALLSDFADMLLIVDGGKPLPGTPVEVLEHSDKLLEIGVNCPRSTSLVNRLRARVWWTRRRRATSTRRSRRANRF